MLYPLKNRQIWKEKISTLSLVKVVRILIPLTIKHFSHVDGKTIISNQRHYFEVRDKNTWNKQFDCFDTLSKTNQNPIKLPNYHYDA